MFKAKREAERQRESWTGWDAPRARRNREARLARLEVQRQRLLGEANERRYAEQDHIDRVWREYLAAEKRGPVQPKAVHGRLERGDRIEVVPLASLDEYLTNLAAGMGLSDSFGGFDDVVVNAARRAIEDTFVRVGDRGTVLNDDGTPDVSWDESRHPKAPYRQIDFIPAGVAELHLIGHMPLPPPPSPYVPLCRTCGHGEGDHVWTENRCVDGCECVGFSDSSRREPLTDAEQESNDRRAEWYLSGRCASCGTPRAGLERGRARSSSGSSCRRPSPPRSARGSSRRTRPPRLAATGSRRGR